MGRGQSGKLAKCHNWTGGQAGQHMEELVNQDVPRV